MGWPTVAAHLSADLELDGAVWGDPDDVDIVAGGCIRVDNQLYVVDRVERGRVFLNEFADPEGRLELSIDEAKNLLL